MVGWVRREPSFHASADSDRVYGGRCSDGIVVVVVGLCRHGKEWLDSGVDTFTPEGYAPVVKGTVEGVDLGVFYQDAPGTNAGFAPRMHVSFLQSVVGEMVCYLTNELQRRTSSQHSLKALHRASGLRLGVILNW